MLIHYSMVTLFQSIIYPPVLDLFIDVLFYILTSWYIFISWYIMGETYKRDISNDQFDFNVK